MRDYEKPRFSPSGSIELVGESMHKNSNNIAIQKSIYINDPNPVYQFSIPENCEPKLFIFGYNDYILDEPRQVNAQTLSDGNEEFYNCLVTDSFDLPGEYIVYIRFMDTSTSEILKEEFFKLFIKFENISTPIIEEVNDKVIKGSRADGKSDIVLYYLNDLDEVEILSKTKSDSNGKFSLEIGAINLDAYKDYHLLLKCIDLYGNSSMSVGIF